MYFNRNDIYAMKYLKIRLKTYDSQEKLRHLQASHDYTELVLAIDFGVILVKTLQSSRNATFTLTRDNSFHW